MFATSQSNGAAATLLPPTAPGELAAFDVTPLLKGSPLQVTRRYIADPATQATLGDILVQHRVMLPSSSKYAVEVGSVEIAMIFDQLFTVRACLRVLFTSINLRQYLLSELHVRTRARSMGIRLNNYVPTYLMTSRTWTPPAKKGRSLAEIGAECSFGDPSIAGGAGYLQVTSAAGTGPVLLVLPENFRFEAWRMLAEDVCPRGVTFEGFYSMLAHSKAWQVPLFLFF